jgi:hypothetical protein
MKILIAIAAEDEVLQDMAASALMSIAGDDVATRFTNYEEVLKIFHENPGLTELYGFGICESITHKSELLLLNGLWIPFHFICVARVDQEAWRHGTDSEFQKGNLWPLASSQILFSTRPKFLNEVRDEWKVILKKARCAQASH